MAPCRQIVIDAFKPLQIWWKSPNSDAFKITLNFGVLILALILMTYEILALEPSGAGDAEPPLWFKLGDLFIIFTLIIEVFMDWLVHNFNCRIFLRSWFNCLDVLVVILSIIGIFDYLTGDNMNAQDVDEASFVVVLKSIAIRSVRVARIIVLVVRTYWEYKNYDEEDYLIMGGRVTLIERRVSIFHHESLEALLAEAEMELGLESDSGERIPLLYMTRSDGEGQELLSNQEGGGPYL